MKFRLSFVGACAVFACSLACAATLPFDFNRDGRIDASDVNQAAMTLSGPISQGGVQYPVYSGSPPVMGDFNGDSALTLADWTALVNYLSVVTGPRALFDIDANGSIDARDRAQIANAINSGRQGACCTQLRFDFNGDGRSDLKDWQLFVSAMQKINPALLIDFNGSGSITGADLDVLARAIDARSYDVQFDLNADGKLDAADWAIAVNLTRQVNPKALYDVDYGTSTVTPVLSVSDTGRIASEISAISTGWKPSIRFDFNADGVVNGADWGDWVRFATLTLRNPDLIFDLDANGVVDASDLDMLTRGYTSIPVQYRLDLNGDGVSDLRDVALLKSRIQYGPPVFLVGDVNRDGCVDIADVNLVQAAVGQSRGMPGYDSALDVDGNGYIDSYDVSLIRGPSFGKCQ